MPTDQSDPVAVLRALPRYTSPDLACDDNTCGEYREVPEQVIADLERRQGREKRLEALVREYARCRRCSGSGSVDVRVDVDELETRECPACAGTGLVEAARKELQDG